jgi:acyl carrier protein phosphodiesterase
VDALPAYVALRRLFDPPYRRYAGLIADLAFDHELARHWTRYASEPLADFDRRVWELAARRRNELPDALLRFVDYAQRRSLFSAYADEREVLRSLAGLGERLTRPNPLHRLAGIWPRAREDCARTFRVIWPQAQSLVAAWVKRNSSNTGS